MPSSLASAGLSQAMDNSIRAPLCFILSHNPGVSTERLVPSCTSLSKPMLNFSNPKHTPLPPLILSSQAQNQIQTSSPNQASAAIPRLGTSNGIDMRISIAFNTSNDMPFNTLSHRLLTCRPSLDPVNSETMCQRRAQVSEGTLGGGDFMCAAAAGARGPRSNGISLTGSEPVLRSGASMSTAYPHSVHVPLGAGAKQAARPQQSQLSPQSQSNPSIASSTVEVPAPHRNTNHTPNLDPDLNPLQATTTITYQSHDTLTKLPSKPSQPQSQSHT
ncbi:hypothetical protein BU17DRAFT_102221 [Hysterangium stoloniferum]|nr:hypothetical protein BU17DRAFT_102221 [Hysterangium stoloniferum]